jgi:hypothetical protein
MMRNETSPVRLNIYLPDQATRRRIKLIAAERNLTLSRFCLQAIQAQLSQADIEKQRTPLSMAVDQARKFQRKAFGGRVFQVNSADLIRQARR